MKDKKRYLLFDVKFALIFVIIILSFSFLALLSFFINWDIRSGEIKGPHYKIAYIGEYIYIAAFYGGFISFIVGLSAFFKGFFNKPRLLNVAVSCLCLILTFVAIHINGITLERVRKSQKAISCHNLRHLGYTLKQYAEEHNGKLPSESKWCDELIKFNADILNDLRKGYIKNDEALSDFALNKNLSEMELAKLPKNIVFLFETKLAKNPSGGAELIKDDNHPIKGCFILFGDMHIEFVRTEDFNNLRWKP